MNEQIMKKIRIRVKKITPKKVVNFYRFLTKSILLFKLNIYDFFIYFKYSAAVRGDFSSKNALTSSIIMDYHRIEKGLSLPDVRPKFGLWFIPDLIYRITHFVDEYGEDDTVLAAINAIQTYRKHHFLINISLKELELDFLRLDNLNIKKSNEGTVNISNDRKTSFPFKEFASSRFSIRDFKTGLISEEYVQNAVSIAKKTPSVCNRQPWRVYFIQGAKINRLLELQNGNRGFRKSVDNLLIITGKISNMRSPTERNQIYIDGGLFSMSLIYAFHSFEIGSCALNWCVEKSNDLKAKQILNLPKDEVIIMYMAIGLKKEKYVVASSPRFKNEKILTILAD